MPNRLVVYGLETDAVEIMQRLYYFAKRLAKAVVAATTLEDPTEIPAAAA